MDLFQCPSCGSVFWASSEASTGYRCPECVARLDLAASGPTSIPGEARSLDGEGWNGSAPGTVILLRKRAEKAGDRIVRYLADHFELTSSGSAVEVSVGAAAVAPPALLVAAILDGIDERWEEHFHLPILISSAPSPEAMKAVL
jgi:hypothetical protein